MFSTWGNNQQNQQQQQTSAFGQPPAFGSTTTNNAFGSTGTSAFGQPAQQQQQSQVNPMFGNISTTPSTNPTGGGFGAFSNNANTTTSAFGAPKPSTGFGAFGGGGTSAFGGGGTTTFGTPAANTSVFGQPSTAGTSAFGGTSNTGTTSIFGGNKFGAQTAPTTTGHPVITTGTLNPPFSAHQEKEPGGTMLHFQSVVCMPHYMGYSVEELRVQDYAQDRKTASTPTGAFGGQTAFGTTQPATTGIFGAQPAQPTTSIFGGGTNTGANSNTGAFGTFGQPAGQPATNTGSVFGGGTSGFGQTQPQQQTNTFGGTSNVFGQQPQQPQQSNIFNGGSTTGPSAFGNTANKPAFGTFGSGGAGGFNSTGGTPAFGNTQQPSQTSNAFGNTQPATNNGFGTFGNTTKPSIFGTPASTTQPNNTVFGTFGNNQQQNQPQQPAQTSIFGNGANTGSFGQQAQQQQQNQPAQTTPLFGGGQTTTPPLFGNSGGTTNLFGNNNNQQQQQQGQQQQGNSPFGNIFNKPAQPTANLFGNNIGQPQTIANQPQPTSIFGNAFGQSGQNNLLFGNKPAAPAMGGSLSGSQAMSTNLFGGSTNTGTQGSLTASIAQPIGDNLPIFSLLPPGPRAVDLEPSHNTKKKPGFFYDLPTRSPVPRIGLNYTPPNSKLRGYGSVSSLTSSMNGLKSTMSFTSGKPGALALSTVDALSSSVTPDFLGRSGSPALGTGGRSSVKKVILDKKVDPADLFVKTGSPGASRTGKIVFSPQLSVNIRENDAAAAPPSLPNQESPTPKSRTQQQKASQSFSGPTTKESTSPEIQEEVNATELIDGDYWVKPDLTTLKKIGYDQLSSFEGLAVGRKGYGEIQFLEPVDLTGLPKLGSLLGEVIRFDDKECSVYPDSEEADKPPPGSGLNVKAKLSLERCWTLDKATREPIKDPNHPQYVKHMKRLRNMKDTHFVGFDMKTGTWTFTVDHF